MGSRGNIFSTILSKCSFHDPSLENITPKCLCVSTSLTMVLIIYIGR